MTNTLNRILAAGAGGFIRRHLASSLRSLSLRWIRAIDIKPFEEGINALTISKIFPWICNREIAAKHACEIYNLLAANMDGMGFMFHHFRPQRQR